VQAVTCLGICHCTDGHCALDDQTDHQKQRHQMLSYMDLLHFLSSLLAFCPPERRLRRLCERQMPGSADPFSAQTRFFGC
jgi:hypothetical protein